MSPPTRLPRPRRVRRTWPQRLLIATNVVVAVGLLGAAWSLRYADRTFERIRRVVVADQVLTPAARPDDGGALPELNVLLTGSDNRDCIDPNSPYAGGFLNGEFGGERSDTIMILRVDPTRQRAAILSFPRDLWVKLWPSGAGRINSAFDSESPERLVNTIDRNFGIPVNHWVDVDFCAFMKLIDTLGGVRVPFASPMRDTHTGFVVDSPQCANLPGDAALAYARSRHLQYYDGRRWREDPSSDFGRIRRQQDLIRRVAQKAIDSGARNPVRLNDLLEVALQYVRVDQTISNGQIVSLARRLAQMEPSRIETYTFRSEQRFFGTADALVLSTDPTDRVYNLAITRIFRGEVPIPSPDDEAAPEPPTFDETTTAGPPSSEAPTTGPATTGAAATAPPAPVTTAPGAPEPDRNPWQPPDDPDCRG